MKPFFEGMEPMSRKPKIELSCNSVITNDPCAICRRRCDPGGLDFMLWGTKKLVCRQCAEKYAPSLVHAQSEALRYADAATWRREGREPYHREQAIEHAELATLPGEQLSEYHRGQAAKHAELAILPTEELQAYHKAEADEHALLGNRPF